MAENLQVRREAMAEGDKHTRGARFPRAKQKRKDEQAGRVWRSSVCIAAAISASAVILECTSRFSSYPDVWAACTSQSMNGSVLYRAHDHMDGVLLLDGASWLSTDPGCPPSRGRRVQDGRICHYPLPAARSLLTAFVEEHGETIRSALGFARCELVNNMWAAYTTANSRSP